MANIKTLVEKFEASILTVTDIKTFVYDDISKINDNRSKTYPVLLLRFLQSSDIPTMGEEYENFNIEFYVFTLHPKNSTDSEETVQQELKTMAIDVIRNIVDGDNLYFLADNRRVRFMYGHFQHNDRLMAVKATCVIRVTDCNITT